MADAKAACFSATATAAVAATASSCTEGQQRRPSAAAADKDFGGTEKFTDREMTLKTIKLQILNIFSKKCS